MSRLLTLFRTSRVVILSAEISRDTIERMAEFGRDDFFDKFSKTVGREVGIVLRSQITDREIALYNSRATEHLHHCGWPYVKLSGAFSYDGVHTTLEKSLAIVGISNTEAVRLASTYFQQAYIYVNKGIFYYFDSKDHEHYYPSATEKWDDMFPGHIKAREKMKPEVDNLHPIPGVGPDAKTGTLLKNKSFIIDFDFNKGADPALTTAIESLQELMHQVFVPKMGHMPLDQAKTELDLWIEKLRMDSEAGKYDAATQAAERAHAYAEVLALSQPD
jgi:hypothetical protein